MFFFQIWRPRVITASCVAVWVLGFLSAIPVAFSKLGAIVSADQTMRKVAVFFSQKVDKGARLFKSISTVYFDFVDSRSDSDHIFVRCVPLWIYIYISDYIIVRNHASAPNHYYHLRSPHYLCQTFDGGPVPLKQCAEFNLEIMQSCTGDQLRYA